MKIEQKIRDRALGLGFQLFGITDSHVDDEQLKFFSQWLKKGKGAGMSDWLSRGQQKRADLGLILPGIKSVIVVGMNYFQGEGGKSQKVARYAWDNDYHEFMGGKLEELTKFVVEIGDPDAKWYVDTGAIFERYFAVKAGLGFIGKNTCLITPQFGSWVCLGVLLTKLDLNPSKTGPHGSCGSCTKCIDACPTGALSEKCVDSRKCISYLTIEKKGDFTEEEFKMVAKQDFCFGCDVCQEVCPHNIRAKKERWRSKSIDTLNLEDIPKTDEEFRAKFGKSPIKRAKRSGILRNLNANTK